MLWDFPRWIKKDGKEYFLTDDIIEAMDWKFEDSLGHDRIRKYYNIKGGYRKIGAKNIPIEYINLINSGKCKKMMDTAGIKFFKIKANGKIVICQYHNGRKEIYKYGKLGCEN